jgi:DNA-directed RNA polymerase specialized sigma24 family protein
MTNAADVERFRQLFEAEHARVYRFVYTMVGAAETAKELTQETFVRAFRGLGAFDLVHDFDGIVYLPRVTADEIPAGLPHVPVRKP